MTKYKKPTINPEPAVLYSGANRFADSKHRANYLVNNNHVMHRSNLGVVMAPPPAPRLPPRPPQSLPNYFMCIRVYTPCRGFATLYLCHRRLPFGQARTRMQNLKFLTGEQIELLQNSRGNRVLFWLSTFSFPAVCA